MLTVVEVIFYVVSIYGAWLLIQPVMQPYVKRTGRQLRITVRSELIQRRRGWLFRHLDRLLYLVDPKYEPGTSVYRFVTRSLILFLAALFLAYMFMGQLPLHVASSNPFVQSNLQQVQGGTQWQFVVLTAVVIGLIPYIVLRLRYQRKRVQSGYDLLEAVQVLARFADQYIDVALNSAADALHEASTLRRPLKFLALAFASYGNEQELREETNRFVQAVSTTFAVSFVSDLMYLHREGGSLRESLLFLGEAMERQRTAVMEARRDTHDSVALGSYGNALVFIMTTGSMAYMLTWSVYVKLQFQTRPGLILFTVVMLSLVVSFVAGRFLSRPKLDYK